MSPRKTLIIIAVAWLASITLLHAIINLHVFRSKHAAFGGEKKLRIGFLPVTCHLTCSVTDFINKQMTGESIFEPVRFNTWPELKEAHLSGYTPATFILAPMAIALRNKSCRLRLFISCSRPL
jgi:NitT/TauT family transport system substrate-binding protein